MGDLGLDVASYMEDMGLTTWSYDTWYRYLGGLRELGVTEIMGQPFHIEDPLWWRDWIHDVAYRVGEGDAFAEGLVRFHDKHEVGPRYLVEFIQSAGSRGHSWHRDGRAMERHPSPFWEYSALLYAVSTRDVTPSTHGFFFLNNLYGYPASQPASDEVSETILDLAERLYGSREAILPGITDVEKSVIWHQHRAIIKDSLGLCDWIFPVLRKTQNSREDLAKAMAAGVDAVIGDPSAEARLYAACTGLDVDIKTLEQPMAERIITLERCLDIRNFGRTRQLDEAVIDHYQWSEKTDGSRLSESADEFRALLDRYYRARGWDEDGVPTEATLEALGIQPN